MTARRDWPKPDLLQQRRLELGLPPDAEVHQPQRHLLLKGAFLGFVLALSPIALVFVLETWQRRLDAEVLELAPVEARVGNAQARLQTMDNKRGALNQQTSRIVAQLVALRSGSALFEQMRQVTPQGVRLLSLVALPSKLIIKGEAEGADALKRINSFALNLETKEELLTNGTSIVKAKANDKGRIDFSLEAAIDSSVRATPERLRELGSEGLARRYELLREQGFDL
jgi:type IV pilus assembly protein PilN